MVFEAISKGLTNLGSSAKKAADTATSPLTDVSHKVLKSVPLMSTHEDIRLQVQDHIRIEAYLDKTTGAHIALLTSLKKNKLPAGCITFVSDELKNISAIIKQETNFEQLQSTHHKLLDTMQKAYRSKLKKKTDLEQANLSTNQTQRQLKADAQSLQDLVRYITTSPTQSNHIKADITNWRKNIHQYNDELISAKFECITQMQKLYYLLMELDKQHRKAKVRANSLTKTKIWDITKTKIPMHQKKITSLLQEIEEIETHIAKENKDLEAHIADRVTYVKEWEKLNLVSSKSIKKEQTLLVKKSWARITKTWKSYSALMKSSSKHYTLMSQDPKRLQDHLKKEIAQYNTLSAEYIDHLSHEYLTYLTQIKDIELDLMTTAEEINRNYDLRGIYKELSLHTALMQRIHKRQKTALDKLTKKLQSVSKTHKIKLPALSKVLKTVSSHIHTHLTWSVSKIKAYKKNMLTLQHTNKKMKSTNTPSKKKEKKLQKSAEKNIKQHMIWLLKPEKKVLSSHITNITSVIQELKSSNIKLDIQIQQTQKSAEILNDTKRKNEALAYEKQLHAQEVALDTLQHHLDSETHHLEMVTDSISDYTKDIKRLK